jgi:hypothetical protein
MAPESRDLVRGRGIGNPSARSRTQSDSCIPELLEPIKKEYRNEIPSNSRFIKYSSLRFKCNSLLHLNRGLPGSAVYDLSTVRHQAQQHWRRLNGSDLIPKVVTGAIFVDGEELTEQAA